MPERSLTPGAARPLSLVTDGTASPPRLPARPPRPSALDAGSSLSAVLRQTLVACVTRLLHQDAGVRRGLDAEAVHEARVATRRLRSDLRMLRPLVDPSWLTPASLELAWLGELLGAVRDTDVLTARLEHHGAELDPRDQKAAAAVLRRLARQRLDARAALVAGLDSQRYGALVGRLVAATDAVPIVPGHDGPARDALPVLARESWRRLKRAVDGLDVESLELPVRAGTERADRALHQVRIRVKRARYAAEVAAPVVGKPARRYARAMAGVQSVLGDHHDAVCAAEWLRHEGARGRAGALVAGQLVAREQADAAAARRQWPAAWARASAKPLRGWFD